MFDFVHTQFLRDPNHRWRWLANVTLACKHRLKDLPLALQYAREIAQLAPDAPPWARQLHIILLEEMGEVESAKIVIGGLLDGGRIKDPVRIALSDRSFAVAGGKSRKLDISVEKLTENRCSNATEIRDILS